MEWKVVPILRRGVTPLYIAGLPASQERPSRDHFHGLQAEVNLALTQYRMYKLQPWPIPSFLVGLNPEAGSGKVLKARDLKVQLNPIGQGQA
ncbi:MAG: hypothetical protein EXR62_17870 [Chloroflexi bacterium]|nr:hypothetical protein [Chloroflexota bacterium]